MYIRPVGGKQVYDPEFDNFLPAGGREVVASQYWLLRLRDGDVETTEAVIEHPVLVNNIVYNEDGTLASWTENNIDYTATYEDGLLITLRGGDTQINFTRENGVITEVTE